MSIRSSLGIKGINNLVGFGAGIFPAISITDDGDFVPSSGTTTATHTYTSQTSTGPYTFLVVTWDNTGGTARTLSSATWSGNSCEILVQATPGAGAAAAILYAGLTQSSGSIVLNFSGTCSDSQITIISLTNLVTSIPIDTDTSSLTSGVGGGAPSLTNLNSPGVGGIRIVGCCHSYDTEPVTPSGWTEIADLDAGSFRHAAGYDLGDDSGTLTRSLITNDDVQDRVMVGVSMR